MTYESPFHLLSSRISAAIDGECLNAVYKVGVTVDKDELLRALKYDRDQYQKGYADGRADAMKWISVGERLPEESGYYLCWTQKYTSIDVLHYSAKHLAFNAFDTAYIPESALPVTHWMRLPQPPKEEDK